MSNAHTYIYPGDAAHLQRALDLSPTAVNPRTVRGFSAYHDLTRTLCSASMNPEHGREILRSVRPHLAALAVAYDAGLAAVAEVADALDLELSDVLGTPKTRKARRAQAVRKRSEAEDGPDHGPSGPFGPVHGPADPAEADAALLFSGDGRGD